MGWPQPHRNGKTEDLGNQSTPPQTLYPSSPPPFILHPSKHWNMFLEQMNKN